MSHLHHEGSHSSPSPRNKGQAEVARRWLCLGTRLDPWAESSRGELISGRRELSVIRGVQAGPGGPLVNGEVWLDSPESLQGM